MPSRSSAQQCTATAQPGGMNLDRSTLNQVALIAGSGCPHLQVQNVQFYSRPHLLQANLTYSYTGCLRDEIVVGASQISDLLARVMGTAAHLRPKAQEISYTVEWQALSPASGLAQEPSHAAAPSKRHVCSWQLFQRGNRTPVRMLRTCRRAPGRHSSSREELRRAARAAKGHLRQLQSLLSHPNTLGRVALETRCGRGAEHSRPGRGACSVLSAPAWALLKVERSNNTPPKGLTSGTFAAWTLTQQTCCVLAGGCCREHGWKEQV